MTTPTILDTAKQNTSMRLVGLRNIVCAKDDWYYLVFYDIDNLQKLNQTDLDIIDKIAQAHSISYLLYSTKHGYHFVGLTPVHAMLWGIVFTKLKAYFKSYYSGNVIRLSRKQSETQVLIRKQLEYGEIIPNLYNLYANRFNYEKMSWNKSTAKYLLVFEKYRSVKE